MKPHDRCPDPDQLVALHRGKLAAAVEAAVCEHLSSCPGCEVRLGAIRDAEDVATENLRRSRDGEPPTLPEDLTLPARLGKYHLTRELGRGGMGVVYAATHTNLNKSVAVKVILPEYADNPRVVARFRREARVVGELSHPNVVTATDADEAGGRHFLVMELVEGLDLETLVRRCGPLAAADAAAVVRQAAVGLQYIHEKGRVHRDLKPSNLMLAADGVVKILDLGLAGVFAAGRVAGGLTGSQHAMGTADYMAPEQWLDSHRVDIRADVYSLGCTLYKLLTGQAPFGDGGHAMLGRKQLAHAETPPPSVRPACPGVPAGLDAVVRRMMAKRPADRFDTPQDVADALAPFVTGADFRGLLAAAPPGRHWLGDGSARASAETASQPGPTPAIGGEWDVTRAARRSRGRRRVAAGVLLLAATGLAAGTLVVSRQSDGGVPSPQPHGVEQPTPPPQQAVALIPAVPAVAPDPGPQLGEWYPLHRRAPVPLFFPNLAHDNFFTPHPAGKKLWVDTNYVGMLGLGQTGEGGYRIRMSFRQTRWTGWVGLFFGYRQATVAGKTCLKYQLLELRPAAHNPEKPFIIERSWGVLADDGKQLRLGDVTGLSSDEIGQPVNGEEYLLQIEVKPKGLTHVSWNGVRLPKLVGDTHNDLLTPADYAGWFGTFNRKSPGWFANAELMLFERMP